MLIGAVVTGMVAVTAAGYGLNARTGLFGEPGMTENDTTEWLDLHCAAEFAERRAGVVGAAEAGR